MTNERLEEWTVYFKKLNTTEEKKKENERKDKIQD
jgi:hypothetical protein